MLGSVGMVKFSPQKATDFRTSATKQGIWVNHLYNYGYMAIWLYIWVNYHISLTRIKAIWWWFPLLTMISSEGGQWGRYNLPKYMIVPEISRRSPRVPCFGGVSMCIPPTGSKPPVIYGIWPLWWAPPRSGRPYFKKKHKSPWLGRVKWQFRISCFFWISVKMTI